MVDSDGLLAALGLPAWLRVGKPLWIVRLRRGKRVECSACGHSHGSKFRYRIAKFVPLGLRTVTVDFGKRGCSPSVEFSTRGGGMDVYDSRGRLTVHPDEESARERMREYVTEDEADAKAGL